MTVCSKCAKLGSTFWEEKPKPRAKAAAKSAARPLPRFPTRKAPSTSLTEALELVGDYSSRIRKTRESLALSHEDLGRKIGEKVSVLRKIESGKMVPDHGVAEKLEHALKVKLLVPPSQPKAPLTIPSYPREITLGEMIKVKERKAEADKERER